MKPIEQELFSTILGVYAEQIQGWDLLAKNYASLLNIRSKEFNIGQSKIIVQYNPARVRSTAAKTDQASIKKRKCFLCEPNLPREQKKVYFQDYYILCNPYPILKEHFTIVSKKHLPQEILSRLPDMLLFAKELSGQTILYNGATSGASAPDHFHFQSVPKNCLPLEKEVLNLVQSYSNLVLDKKGIAVHQTLDYLRNCVVVCSSDSQLAEDFFQKFYKEYQSFRNAPGEPGMNLICFYQESRWYLVILPRKQHRPEQYFLEGSEQFIISPGSVDMGGVLITIREEDFNKITDTDIKSIFSQVSDMDFFYKKTPGAFR